MSDTEVRKKVRELLHSLVAQHKPAAVAEAVLRELEALGGEHGTEFPQEYCRMIPMWSQRPSKKA